MKLQSKEKIKLIAMDLDGTLTQHRETLTKEARAALDALGKKYRLLMVGAGQVGRIFRQMDAPVHEYFRELKLRRALYRLRRYPELQATLKAIYRYRFQPRQKIFSALKIRGETYRRRFSDLTKILKIST